jgi:hypothetical protein
MAAIMKRRDGVVLESFKPLEEHLPALFIQRADRFAQITIDA